MPKATDEMKALRTRYLELVALYGKHATDFQTFKQTLLDMNERHRLEGKRLYTTQIAKIERKMGRDRP
jgi:hypothetical protein